MAMNAISTYPHAKPRISSTKAAVAVMGILVTGTGSVFEIGKADNWWNLVQPRVSFSLSKPAPSELSSQRIDVRTTAEHIENIRHTLNPSMADLAGVFGVSRQAIYKWISQDSEPEADTFAKVVELSQVGDAFRESGIERTGSLIKMKAFNGLSLLDLIRSQTNSPEHVALLISEAKAMEDSYNASALQSSKATPTNDWQGYISIPNNTESA